MRLSKRHLDREPDDALEAAADRVALQVSRNKAYSETLTVPTISLTAMRRFVRKRRTLRDMFFSLTIGERLFRPDKRLKVGMPTSAKVLQREGIY